MTSSRRQIAFELRPVGEAEAVGFGRHGRVQLDTGTAGSLDKAAQPCGGKLASVSSFIFTLRPGQAKPHDGDGNLRFAKAQVRTHGPVAVPLQQDFERIEPRDAFHHRQIDPDMHAMPEASEDAVMLGGHRRSEWPADDDQVRIACRVEGEPVQPRAVHRKARVGIGRDIMIHAQGLELPFRLPQDLDIAYCGEMPDEKRPWGLAGRTVHAVRHLRLAPEIMWPG